MTDGYAKVPRALLENPGLSVTAKILYACVQSHANADGVAWPSIKRLAEMTGASRPTVMKGLTALVDAGWLSRQRRGQTQVNVYILKSTCLTSDLDNEGLRSQPGLPLKSNIFTAEVNQVDTNENHLTRTNERDGPETGDEAASADADIRAPDPVGWVFDYYREYVQPDAKPSPTPKMRAKIAARLKRFTVDELTLGVEHFAADGWCMEHNRTRGAAWFFATDERSEHYLLMQPRPGPESTNGRHHG